MGQALKLSFHPVLGTPALILVTVLSVALIALIWRVGGVRKLARWRRTALLVVLVAMCTGPSLPGETREVLSNVEVHIAIDRTGSMAAEDWDGGKPRLDGVKQDLLTLADAMGGAQFSVTTWDTRANVVLPVTSDQSAFRSIVDTLHQEPSSSSQGSSMEHVRAQLETQLADAKERRPQNVRYLFVLSDGESSNTASQAISDQWAALKQYVDGGAVIGYGTEAGGRMKQYSIGGSTGDYIRDPSKPGSPDAISVIDEGNLRNVAGQVGLKYIHSPDTGAISGEGTSLMSGAEFLAEDRQDVRVNRYILWPLALVGAGLLAWEGWYLAGRFATLRRQHAL